MNTKHSKENRMNEKPSNKKQVNRVKTIRTKLWTYKAVA